jgi:hypothetical protein
MARFRGTFGTDTARDSQYARSGEEAGSTAAGGNGRVSKYHGERGAA